MALSVDQPLFYNSPGKINEGAIVARLFPQIDRLMLYFVTVASSNSPCLLFYLIIINCLSRSQPGKLMRYKKWNFNSRADGSVFTQQNSVFMELSGRGGCISRTIKDLLFRTSKSFKNNQINGNKVCVRSCHVVIVGNGSEKHTKKWFQ